MYRVYVKPNENGCITAVNSSAFLTDLDGWVEIDSGLGDKYHHAQNNYLDKPLYDERGIMRYRLVLGVPQERTREDMDSDWIEPVQQPDPLERIAALENALKAIEEGITSA